MPLGLVLVAGVAGRGLCWGLERGGWKAWLVGCPSDCLLACPAAWLFRAAQGFSMQCGAVLGCAGLGLAGWLAGLSQPSAALPPSHTVWLYVWLYV